MQFVDSLHSDSEFVDKVKIIFVTFTIKSKHFFAGQIFF